MGFNHCSVYTILKEMVDIGGEEVYARDIMSPGFIKDSVR
jgi:hypothetical protein